MVTSVRRIVLHLPRSFPYLDSFHRLALNLGARSGPRPAKRREVARNIYRSRDDTGVTFSAKIVPRDLPKRPGIKLSVSQKTLRGQAQIYTTGETPRKIAHEITNKMTVSDTKALAEILAYLEFAACASHFRATRI